MTIDNIFGLIEVVNYLQVKPSPMTIVPELPNDIVKDIFCKLNLRDLASCCEVSQLWNELANDSRVWKAVAKQFFSEDLYVPDIKKYIKEHEFKILYSSAKILEKVQAFANRVPIGQNGRFRCRLGNNSNDSISITIKASKYFFENFTAIDNLYFDIYESYIAVIETTDDDLDKKKLVAYHQKQKHILEDIQNACTHLSYIMCGRSEVTSRNTLQEDEVTTIKDKNDPRFVVVYRRSKTHFPLDVKIIEVLRAKYFSLYGRQTASTIFNVAGFIVGTIAVAKLYNYLEDWIAEAENSATREDISITM